MCNRPRWDPAPCLPQPPLPQRTDHPHAPWCLAAAICWRSCCSAASAAASCASSTASSPSPPAACSRWAGQARPQRRQRRQACCLLPAALHCIQPALPPCPAAPPAALAHRRRQQARGHVQACLQGVRLELLQLGVHLAPQAQVQLGGAVQVGRRLLRRQAAAALLPQGAAGGGGHTAVMSDASTIPPAGGSAGHACTVCRRRQPVQGGASGCCAASATPACRTCPACRSHRHSRSGPAQWGVRSTLAMHCRITSAACHRLPPPPAHRRRTALCRSSTKAPGLIRLAAGATLGWGCAWGRGEGPACCWRFELVAGCGLARGGWACACCWASCMAGGVLGRIGGSPGGGCQFETPGATAWTVPNARLAAPRR